MAEWTQKEIEELMVEMTKKSMTDPEFRREVLADATAALEKLAGRPLPEGISLKCVEKDPNYQNTLVLPDLIDEEKLDDSDLANVAGGVNILGIVSICAAALGVGPDAAACLVDYVQGEACAAKGCGYNACGGRACAAFGEIVPTCSHHACAAHAIGNENFRK